MTDTYTNSKGVLVLIANMAHPHLKSALAKAERDYDADQDVGGARMDEIEAMRVDLARRDAEYAAQQVAESND